MGFEPRLGQSEVQQKNKKTAGMEPYPPTSRLFITLKKNEEVEEDIVKGLILTIALSVGSTFLVTGNAFAVSIDFRDSYYSAIKNERVGSFYSTKDNLTLMAMPPSSPTNPDPYLTWYADDGIGGGGSSYEEDEWELIKDNAGLGDYLVIIFDNSVSLSEILLTDFFYEERQGHWYEETGYVEFLDNNGNWLGGSLSHPFSQTDHTVLPSPASNGEYVIDVASLIGVESLVQEIYLFGLGYRWVDGFREDHEFSVAGLNTNPVPEPATMLLFGVGLIGIAGFGRKKLIKKQ